MKKAVVIVLALVCLTFFANAQSATDLITTMRIGIFKIKATKADVEKIIGKKLENKSKEYTDSIDINYNGTNYTLVFSPEYNEDGKKPVVYSLYSVSAANTPLKTKSLIGIGSTKAEILQAYDKFDLTINNDYAYKEKGNTKDKIQFISLPDYDSGTRITFTTENRVVKKIEVSIDEGGD